MSVETYPTMPITNDWRDPETWMLDGVQRPICPRCSVSVNDPVVHRDYHLEEDGRCEFRQSLVAIYEEALKAIRGPMDDPTGLDWRMQAYREAGGGYEGLQAIANAALAAGATSTGSGDRP